MNIVLDTETTGLLKHPNAKDEVQPRVIEFAAVRCDRDGNIIDTMTQLINPGVEVSEEITGITGITNEMLAAAPRFGDVADIIFRYIEEADQVIAHNLPFDSMQLDLEAARLSRQIVWPKYKLCTVEEHLPIIGHRPKLTDLYEQYTGTKLNQTHRALDDVEALVVVCKAAGVLI